jgi:hypothetical protein
MRRLAVVVASYLLSSFGLLIMFKLILEGIHKPHPNLSDIIIPVVWLTAWACHLVMSIAWIIGKHLGPVWVVGGTLAGISSFMVWFAVSASMQVPAVMAKTFASTSMILTVAQLVLVLPCFLLALWLVRFHWRKD